MTILLLLPGLGCERARDEARSRHLATLAALYPTAWGVEMSEERLAEAARRFDCVWEHAADAGGDPANDYACLGQQLEAYFECTEQDTSEFSRCHDRAQAGCTRSASFEAALAACPPQMDFLGTSPVP